MRASRFLVALGVVLLGLCAALPFRQSPPHSPAPLPPATMPMSLTLRRPDAPLELVPRTDISPAIGLQSMEPASQPGLIDPRSLAADRALDLGNLAPPPALPVSFQPSAGQQPASDWRPEPSTRPARPQAKPRPYRLRDGDTLEGLAERFLGSRERAAEIFEANRDVLARPDLLPVGVPILLPPRESADDLVPVKAN